MNFLKKHWKKIVLAVFASFWASCSDEASTEPVALYGCPADVCNEQPEPVSSESQEPVSSESQETIESSSSYIKWISSSSMPPILYGAIPVYSSSSEPASKAPNSCYKTTKTEYTTPGCEGDICPVYGVMYVEKTACECDDGVTYTVEELRDKFNLTAIEVLKLCQSNKKE